MEIISIYPNVGDTAGGGGPVVITVDSSEFATGATLGGVALTSFGIKDPTHVWGVPGAYPNHAVVDVVVTYDPPPGDPPKPDTVGVLLFEYWTPGDIGNVDVYLDAAKGVTADAATKAVSSWKDQGPNAREFVQATDENQPTQTGAVFGPMPSIHFEPTVDAAGTHSEFLRLAADVSLPARRWSAFAVAKWTANGGPTVSGGNVPLTIVGHNSGAFGAFGANAGAIESRHNGGGVTVNRSSSLNDDVARLIGATQESIDQIKYKHTETKTYVGNNEQGVDSFVGELVTPAGEVVYPTTYDSIGAGWVAPDGSANGWEGDLGAVIIASGPISVEDRTRLDMWAQQRFGTPRSEPLDAWSRVLVGPMPMAPEWFVRDGAQMVQLASGRVLLVGGWNPYMPWDGVFHTTNEVWASDDRGETWFRLLAHDPNPPACGAGARFAPGHTVGLTTYKGRAVLIGSDPYAPNLLGDVWHSSDGETWTRIATDAPTAGRCLFMIGKLGENIYMIGGMHNSYHEESGISDAWRLSDGGLTWTEVAPPPWKFFAPPAPRGMSYRPVEHDGKLVIVGGGRYDEFNPVVYNGVFAFDGNKWETVLEDGHNGLPQWEPCYWNSVAALGRRIWLFNGSSTTTDYNRTVYSEDGGASWKPFPGGAGGHGSHADAVLALDDRILRIPPCTGTYDQRLVYKFVHT